MPLINWKIGSERNPKCNKCTEYDFFFFLLHPLKCELITHVTHATPVFSSVAHTVPFWAVNDMVTDILPSSGLLLYCHTAAAQLMPQCCQSGLPRPPQTTPPTPLPANDAKHGKILAKVGSCEEVFPFSTFKIGFLRGNKILLFPITSVYVTFSLYVLLYTAFQFQLFLFHIMLSQRDSIQRKTAFLFWINWSAPLYSTRNVHKWQGWKMLKN